jgi:hypothetical protein
MKELKPPREVLSADENGKLIYKPLTQKEMAEMYTQLNKEELIDALVYMSKAVEGFRSIIRSSVSLEDAVSNSYLFEEKLKLEK